MYMAGRITFPGTRSRLRAPASVAAPGCESIEGIAEAERKEAWRAWRVEGRVAQRIAALRVGREGLGDESSAAIESGRAELSRARVVSVEQVGDAREQLQR